MTWLDRHYRDSNSVYTGIREVSAFSDKEEILPRRLQRWMLVRDFREKCSNFPSSATLRFVIWSKQKFLIPRWSANENFGYWKWLRYETVQQIRIAESVQLSWHDLKLSLLRLRPRWNGMKSKIRDETKFLVWTEYIWCRTLCTQFLNRTRNYKQIRLASCDVAYILIQINRRFD